jgi:hypothetical protein
LEHKEFFWFSYSNYFRIGKTQQFFFLTHPFQVFIFTELANDGHIKLAYIMCVVLKRNEGNTEHVQSKQKMEFVLQHRQLKELRKYLFLASTSSVLKLGIEIY